MISNSLKHFKSKIWVYKILSTLKYKCFNFNTIEDSLLYKVQTFVKILTFKIKLQNYPKLLKLASKLKNKIQKIKLYSFFCCKITIILKINSIYLLILKIYRKINIKKIKNQFSFTDIFTFCLFKEWIKHFKPMMKFLKVISLVSFFDFVY